MPVQIRNQPLSRAALVAVLVLAVLFAQWAGMIHRIVHADRMAAPAGVVSEFKSIVHHRSAVTQSDDSQDKHSCAAFDAATLAASLPMPIVCTPVIPGADVLAFWAAFISWHAPFTHFFSSRAPPFA